MNNNNLLITAILVIVFTIAGFYGGIRYQQSKVPSFGGRFTQVERTGNLQNSRGRMMGGGNIFGDIIASDEKSITVKLADGSSKIILVTSSTSIDKASSATIADFKVGEKVSAFGVANADGSLTAANIQLNPIIRGQISPTPISK
ncbi:MAG: DUF5666 domain-containing protein [Microgenomates group bacterium]